MGDGAGCTPGLRHPEHGRHTSGSRGVVDGRKGYRRLCIRHHLSPSVIRDGGCGIRVKLKLCTRACLPPAGKHLESTTQTPSHRALGWRDDGGENSLRVCWPLGTSAFFVFHDLFWIKPTEKTCLEHRIEVSVPSFVSAYLHTTTSPAAQGAFLADVPVVNGQLLDLVALLGAITKRGGVRRVQDQRLWNEVGIPATLDHSARGGQPRRDGLHEAWSCFAWLCAGSNNILPRVPPIAPPNLPPFVTAVLWW